jgi:xanthine dehydrogenase molybdopterin-binding subunit B
MTACILATFVIGLGYIQGLFIVGVGVASLAKLESLWYDNIGRMKNIIFGRG